MSHTDDDVTKNFILVMRMIADLSLEVQTCRVVMQAHGITDRRRVRDNTGRAEETRQRAS